MEEVGRSAFQNRKYSSKRQPFSPYLVKVALILLLICTLLTQTHAKGWSIEIIENATLAHENQHQQEFDIKESDIISVLDQVGCCKLKNSAIKLTSNITVNGTPFQLVKFLSVRCKDDQTSKQVNEYCVDNKITLEKQYFGKVYQQQQSVNSQIKRHLAGVVDPTKCTATGTGVSTFNTNTQVTITVTAKDSSSTNVGVGNEVVFVEITNACTKGKNYECVANHDQQTVLTSDIVAQMTDNHDGTYTYNYSVTRPGQITVSVLHYTNGGVYQEFFPNQFLSGDNGSNGTRSDINVDWGNGVVYSTYSDNVSAKFYFRFKAPITGSLVFYVGVDDDTTMSVNSTQILAHTCCGTFTASTINVVKNQYYKGYVSFIEYGGGAYIKLYWLYSSAQTIVPSTSLYYPTYITSAPIQITVTCPSGYSTSTSAGYPQCVTTCGDGYRAGSEACDDSNTTPNDGCSATCTVESGYTCTGGSGTSRDTCSKPAYSCPSGYTCTSGSCASISDCSQTVTSVCSSDYNLSSFNRWMALGMWSSVIICFIVDMIVSCLTDRYPSGLYTCLEHIQLFTILPLAGSCFSSEVNGFFRLSRYSLLSFDFINIKQVFYISSDYNQYNSVLNFIGFSSSSTIINIGGYLIIGLCIVFVEMLVFKLFKNMYQTKVEANSSGVIFKTSSRLKQWMSFGAPIRFLLLGFVLINTAGIDELNNYSVSNHRWSWWLTLFILFVFTFIFSCTMLLITLSNDHQALNESRVFSELVNGLKANSISKLYTFIFMIYRILTVIFLIANINLTAENKLISLICLHSVYLLFITIIRPFNSINANISKIICEMFILILLSLMISHTSSSNWSNSVKYAFIYIMTISSCIPCIITLISAVPQIKSYRNQNSLIVPKQINHLNITDSNIGIKNNTRNKHSRMFREETKDNSIFGKDLNVSERRKYEADGDLQNIYKANQRNPRDNAALNSAKVQNQGDSENFKSDINHLAKKKIYMR